MTNEIPKYYSTPEMRIDCKNDEEKFKITDKAIQYFTNNYGNSTSGVQLRDFILKHIPNLNFTKNSTKIFTCWFYKYLIKN